MKQEEIMNKALEIYNKPLREFTREYGDVDGMMEFLDGAIGELVNEAEQRGIDAGADGTAIPSWEK